MLIDNILDDHSFVIINRQTASAITNFNLIPTFDPPLRETAMRDNLQCHGIRIEELDIAEISS